MAAHWASRTRLRRRWPRHRPTHAGRRASSAASADGACASPDRPERWRRTGPAARLGTRIRLPYERARAIPPRTSPVDRPGRRVAVPSGAAAVVAWFCRVRTPFPCVPMSCPVQRDYEFVLLKAGLRLGEVDRPNASFGFRRCYCNVFTEGAAGSAATTTDAGRGPLIRIVTGGGRRCSCRRESRYLGHIGAEGSNACTALVRRPARWTGPLLLAACEAYRAT